MKIGVVGAGSVGVGVCQHIISLGGCSDLVLLDLNRTKAEGEILDFGHAHSLTFSKNIRLRGTDDYYDLEGCGIVVVTAGAQIKKGQTRLSLAEVNSRITVEIAQKIEKVAPQAILIVVTNPCDICTYFIVNNTGFPSDRVMSAGCIVDTARLMKIVSDRTHVDPKNVSGYVLGEHGHHCFLPWSLLDVAGQPIDDFCDQNGLDRIDHEELLEAVRQAGLEVFNRKQNTVHAIAASVYRIIQAIEIDEHSVLPVGTLLQGEYGLRNVVLSLPTVIHRHGTSRILKYAFDDSTRKDLYSVAEVLQGVTAQVAVATGLKA